MAEAAGHKFGQFVGEYCEAALEPLLQEFADRHGLFLDKKGARPARKGKKLTWIDSYGFGHDLDYVLERGGRPDKVGTQVAFIESAWRRYTKHSKNKAQEITGAVLPIANKHSFSAPMIGCILIGDYTAPALKPLEGIGFRVLYLDYASVREAFMSVGIDAYFDKDTPEEVHTERMRQWEALSKEEKDSVWTRLIEKNKRKLDDFMDHLTRAVRRQINAVRVIPLHGAATDCITIDGAIAFVEKYDEMAPHGPLVKYEVVVRYDNGDKIEAEFQDRASTIDFLRAYQSGNWAPAIDTLDDEVE